MFDIKYFVQNTARKFTKNFKIDFAKNFRGEFLKKFSRIVLRCFITRCTALDKIYLFTYLFIFFF